MSLSRAGVARAVGRNRNILGPIPRDADHLDIGQRGIWREGSSKARIRGRSPFARDQRCSAHGDSLPRRADLGIEGAQELALIEVSVGTAAGHECIVTALLNDAPGFHDQNEIRISNR